jgi:TolB-like protein
MHRHHELKLGNLTLQPRRQLLRDGMPVALGRKALDILSVLAEAKGALVTKDELMAAVWPGLVIEENAIQVHIGTLRKALGNEARRLSTVRGLGYQLDSGEREPESDAGEVEARSLAVLPFTNLTGDPSKDHLGDGLAEELISTLARASDLRVPARTSTFAYKGRGADIRHIARELGVDAVLEGSVRAAGERIRINVQLVDAKSGFDLWSESYDRRFEDLFALQDELAAAITAELRARLCPHDKPTQDPEAFHLHLQARGLSNWPSLTNLEQALDLLKKAVARDPGFAGAYSSIARVLIAGRSLHYMPGSRLDEARHYAERAVALDPLLAEGHMVLGTLQILAGNWLDGTESLARIDTPDNHDAMFVQLRAVFGLLPLGHLRMAHETLERAVSLAPAWSAPWESLGNIAVMAGDHAEAERLANVAVSLGFPEDRPPVCNVRAEAHLASGRLDEAAALMAAALGAPFHEAGAGEVCLRVCRALGGALPREQALAAIDKLLEAPGAEQVTEDFVGNAGVLMDWYIRLGALDRAFGVAERIIADWQRTGLLDVVSLIMLWSVRARPFRDDPRFQELAARLGMFAFWERNGPPDGYILRDGRLEPSAAI